MYSSFTSIHLQIRPGPQLLSYIRQARLQGHNGNITFDPNGDIRGKYDIANVQRSASGQYFARRFAVYDTTTETLTIDDSLVIWKVVGDDELTGDNLTTTAPPRSQCGQECHVGEVYSYFKDTCCWECRRCNANERTAANATRCEACPPLAWPDPSSNLTGCAALVPGLRDWRNPVVALFAALGVIGVTTSCLVFVVFVRYNGDRLIKATSRELSHIMLTGTVLQYSLLYAVLANPNRFHFSIGEVSVNEQTVVLCPKHVARSQFSM